LGYTLVKYWPLDRNPDDVGSILFLVLTAVVIALSPLASTDPRTNTTRRAFAAVGIGFLVLVGIVIVTLLGLLLYIVSHLGGGGAVH
jgi:hypothetical protein